jgi:dephospho-CoA kinase
MLTVGIAGGSGTGKSTIGAHVVRRYGGTHIDADRIAHAVLQDPPVMRRIFERFGPDMVDTDGQVNRHRLGARVFTDAGSRAALNEIVHPEVIRRCTAAVAGARSGAGRVVVVDAALLLEVAMPFDLDLTLALRCDREIRRARLMAKGGWTEAEIRARLDAQDGMEKHFYKADAVIDTGRELNAVLVDADALVAAALQSESER